MDETDEVLAGLTHLELRTFYFRGIGFRHVGEVAALTRLRCLGLLTPTLGLTDRGNSLFPAAKDLYEALCALQSPQYGTVR